MMMTCKQYTFDATIKCTKWNDFRGYINCKYLCQSNRTCKYHLCLILDNMDTLFGNVKLVPIFLACCIYVRVRSSMLRKINTSDM